MVHPRRGPPPRPPGGRLFNKPRPPGGRRFLLFKEYMK